VGLQKRKTRFRLHFFREKRVLDYIEIDEKRVLDYIAFPNGEALISTSFFDMFVYVFSDNEPFKDASFY